MKWTIIEKSTSHIINIVNWDGNGTYDLPETHEMRQWQEGDVIWRENNDPLLPNLTASQFHYMLASTGLHNVMDGVLQYLESNNHPMFPVVYGHLSGQTFFLSTTLEVLAQLRDLIASLYPEADTSDEFVMNAWQSAMEWNS